MSKIIRWETPFTDFFYPAVVLIGIPIKPTAGIINNLKVVIWDREEYPKYLVDFGDVIAFTYMDESCCPQRDFSSATFEETITKDKFVCAFQWFDSPWLKSYEGCHDPESTGKFSHFLIFGGDNNVEVITKNVPTIRLVEHKETLKMEYEF